jgi:hypothetical protein
MNEWGNNSRVVHAVASTAAPGGRGYTLVNAAVPAFSHCVDSLALNVGTANETWLLFHNGDGMPRACQCGSPDCSSKPLQWLATCASGNGTTPSDCCEGHPAPPLPEGFEPSNGVHVATSPYGPWKHPAKEALVGFPFCDCPAVHVLKNGSIAVWCQALYPTGVFTPDTHVPMYINAGWGTPFVAHTTSLRVPADLYQRAVQNGSVIKLDDPTMYVDARGNWHALMHNGDGPFPCGDVWNESGAVFRDGNPYPIGCTAHIFSRDGVGWTMSPLAASNASIALDGGRGSVDLFRQRPKVKLNAAGDAPTHLFHGAMQCGERVVTGGDAPWNHCSNTSWPRTNGAAQLGIDTYDGMDYSFTTLVALVVD